MDSQVGPGGSEGRNAEGFQRDGMRGRKRSSQVSGGRVGRAAAAPESGLAALQRETLAPPFPSSELPSFKSLPLGLSLDFPSIRLREAAIWTQLGCFLFCSCFKELPAVWSVECGSGKSRNAAAARLTAETGFP